jgi:NTE family protein
MTNTTRALVLGGGAIAGLAWMAGLASGLRRERVDLADADLIVGTSAGAIVGTMLATGQDLDLLDAPARPADQGDSAPTADPGRLTEVFTILRDASLEPADARRRVGLLALAAETITESPLQWDSAEGLMTAGKLRAAEPVTR